MNYIVVILYSSRTHTHTHTHTGAQKECNEKCCRTDSSVFEIAYQFTIGSRGTSLSSCASGIASKTSKGNCNSPYIAIRRNKYSVAIVNPQSVSSVLQLNPVVTDSVCGSPAAACAVAKCWQSYAFQRVRGMRSVWPPFFNCNHFIF